METFTWSWIQALSVILVQYYTIPFLSLAFMLKCLLISFYSLLMYWGICIIRRVWGKKMSVRASYNCWYALLLSFPLSGLEINNVVKLPCYDLFLSIYSHRPGSTPEQLIRIIKTVNALRLLLLIATVVWLIAVLVKCLRQTAVNIRLQRAIRRQQVYDDQDGLKQKAAEALGLRPEKICVVAADFVRSPVSYGVFRKTILLPHDYKGRYTLSEQFLLLLHEMGHIKNYDTVKLQLIDIAACFIWPLRLMKKHIIRDSEILCDNRVLGIGTGERDTYGELIVRECSVQKAVKGLGFSDSFHTIKSRLDAIYSHRPEKHHIAAFAVAMALMLAGTCVYASRHPAAWLKTFTEEEAILKTEEFAILVRFIDEDFGGMNWHYAYELPLLTMEYDEWVSNMERINLAVSDTYHYADGQLVVDKMKLCTYLCPYIEEGLPVTEVSFVKHTEQYIDTTRQGLLGESTGGTASVDMRSSRIYDLSLIEIEQADESDRYTAFTVPRVTWAELVNLFAAHWL